MAPMFSKVLIGLSVLTLVVAALVSLMGLDLWLAGTQWMLVAIALAIYALYAHHCTCEAPRPS